MSGYTAAQARADYSAMLREFGEDITLVRGATEKTVTARLMQQDTGSDVGSRVMAGRTFLVLASDVTSDPAFPVPFQLKSDRIRWNSKTLVVTRVDDSKRRIAGELIAYEIEAAGA